MKESWLSSLQALFRSNPKDTQQHRVGTTYLKMSFAPVIGLESASLTHIRSSSTAFFSSFAILYSSILTAVSALIDNLATRIPPSCCVFCQLQNIREPHHDTGNKNTALVFDPGTDIYTLKKLEDIDGALYITLPKLIPSTYNPPQSKRPSTATSSPAPLNPSEYKSPANPKSSPTSSLMTTLRTGNERGPGTSLHSSTASTSCPRVGPVPEPPSPVRMTTYTEGIISSSNSSWQNYRLACPSSSNNNNHSYRTTRLSFQRMKSPPW